MVDILDESKDNCHSKAGGICFFLCYSAFLHLPESWLMSSVSLIFESWS